MPLTSTHLPHDHFVQFYEDDLFLIDSLRDYIVDGLQTDDAIVLAVTNEHRPMIDEAVRDADVDLDAAIAGGRFVALDARTLMSRFMMGGMPDPLLFVNSVGNMVDQAARGGRMVRIFGEMVALLWDEGNVDATIALERCWNDLARTHRFHLYCAYPMAAFENDADGSGFRKICKQHSSVVPSENYSRATDPDQRLRTVAELQQRAISRDREVEALRAKQLELEAALEHLREMERSRGEFVSMVVHDIRNPAAVLAGLLEIIKHRVDLGEDFEDLVARAISSNKQIQALTNDLATVSKIESGTFVFRFRDLDIGAIVRETVGTFGQASKDVKFETVIAPHLPLARGDHARMVQVLSNLLTNAVKFSPPGSTVSVSVGKKGPHLVVRVRDQGWGISVEDRARLFRPFSQLDQSSARNVQGSGLGLYICKLLIEAHHGSIWAESHPGRGTTFTYTVPIVSPSR